MLHSSHIKIVIFLLLQAIKLETCTEHARYLAIVVTDVGDRKEGVIIGFHVTKESAHLGLVLPINPKTEMCLDGDG